MLAAIEFIRRNALLPLAAVAEGLPTDRVYRFDRLGSPDLSKLVHSGQPASRSLTDIEAALWPLVDAFLTLRTLAQAAQPQEIDVP